VVGALKDLAFAIGERVFVCAPGFGGESVINGAKTRVDAADGFSNLGGGRLFEEVAAGSGVKCAAKVAGTREGGDDDDAGIRVGEFQVGGKFKASLLGHLDIGDEDIGGVKAGAWGVMT
jgi:hypothetical protein